MSNIHTKKILTDMISKIYSSDMLLSKAFVITFYLTSSNVAHATSCTTGGGPQNLLSASNGLQCESNVASFSGANVVSVSGEGSSQSSSNLVLSQASAKQQRQIIQLSDGTFTYANAVAQ